MDGNMTPADIMAMTKDDDGMANIWNNPFVYLIWIWAFRMFGNGFVMTPQPRVLLLAQTFLRALTTKV